MSPRERELADALRACLDWINRESCILIDRSVAEDDITLIPTGCRSILEHYGELADWTPKPERNPT